MSEPKKVRDREDAFANTRDACATQFGLPCVGELLACAATKAGKRIFAI
jgi:hypothetical protein